MFPDCIAPQCPRNVEWNPSVTLVPDPSLEHENKHKTMTWIHFKWTSYFQNNNRKSCSNQEALGNNCNSSEFKPQHMTKATEKGILKCLSKFLNASKSHETDLTDNETDLAFNETDLAFNETELAFNETDLCFNWSFNETDLLFSSIVQLYHSTLQPTKQPQQSNQALALTPLKSRHTKHCTQMAESYARHAIHL